MSPAQTIEPAFTRSLNASNSHFSLCFSTLCILELRLSGLAPNDRPARYGHLGTRTASSEVGSRRLLRMTGNGPVCQAKPQRIC